MVVRKVELHLPEAFYEAIGGETVMSNPNLCRAYGWLAGWAAHQEKYQNVTIYGDKDGNLNATYRDAQGNVTYSIFAERKDSGEYGFHS